MKVFPFVQFVVFFNYTVTVTSRQIWFSHRCKENLQVKVRLAHPESHTFDRSVYRWYVVGKLVHYSLLFFMSFRLIIIAHLFSANVPLTSHASTDPNLVHIVSHFRFFQDSITLSITVMITALLPLYVLFIDFAESTLLDVNLTRLVTGFSVNNTEDIFRNNRNLIKPTLIVSKPLRSIQHCFEVCRTLWAHCESNWNVSRLDLQVPHLSGPLRVRLVAFTMACELISAILLTTLRKVCTLQLLEFNFHFL